VPERIAGGGKGRGGRDFDRIEFDPIERSWPESLQRQHQAFAQGLGVARVFQPLE
jgi:hypothetical protein